MELTEKIIKSMCSSTIYKRGVEYFKQGRVHIKVRDEDKITAVVDGDAVYNVQVKMSEDKIDGYYCSCPYFDTMNSVCKHIVATMLQRKAELENTDENFTDDNERLTSKLCADFNAIDTEKRKIHLKFEVSVLSKGFCEREFGIKVIAEGKTLEYPENFLECIRQGEPFKINRYTEYSAEKCCFGDAESEVLSILTESYESRLAQSFLYNRAYGEILVGEEAMKRIFEALPRVDYSFIFNRMNMGRANIKRENPDVLIDISAADGEINLYSGNYGTALSRNGELFYFEDVVYITDKEWQKLFMPIYNGLASDLRTQLSFKGDNAIVFASCVLPKVRTMRGVVTNGIEDTVINEVPEIFVYLDNNGREILCTVKASYGDISLILPEAVHNSKKIVVRNLELENRVLELISDFEYKNGYYRLTQDEDIFDFLKNRMQKLFENASVLVSERFSKLKIHREIGISGNVSYNETSGLLEADLKTELSYEEIRDILSAVKLKKSFYRLSDGSFADLEDEGARLSELMRAGFDAADILEEKKILPRYQLLYLNALAENGKNSKISVSADITEYVNKIKNLKLKLSESLDKTLRGYQKEGVNWLKQLSALGLGGILADDMGLGKTLQVLAFLYCEKPEKPVLIVTPSSLTYNWKNEMQKFIPDASVMIVDGPGEERAELINKLSQFDFLITSYPLLRRDIAKYEDIEFSYCIIDEAQNIKNPRTMNAISVKKIKADHRVALTGTPIENSLSELWSVFDFLMPGYLYRYSDFREWFEAPITKDGDENALSELKAKISPFILRRMKKDVLEELPEKIESTVYADMTEEQEKLYAAYSHIAKDRTLSILSEGSPKMEILTLLMRLRQISCHPSLFDDNYKHESGKLQVLTELVTTAVSSKHRILVFSQFTSMLELIKKELKHLGIDYFYLDGATKPERRTELAERFNGGERDVFLISLKAGGFGLNLTGADMVIHYDPWWNPAVTEQASDRAYRIGQTKNVQVIRLASKGTIEEKILKLAETKKKLAQDVVDAAAGGLAGMSAEEILSLFD